MLTRDLGLVDYSTTYAAMQAFTAARQADTPDELWLCQHHPVFTQGLAGKADHVLMAGDIPVVQTDRGGQVTYHGPGQIMAYPLLHLHRLNIFVKEYVYRLEEAAIRTLWQWSIVGHRVQGAPGIYVRLDNPFSHAVLPKGDPKHPDFNGLGKIAALGVKVTRGYTYHGLSLNAVVDVAPFSRINPCGYAGLPTVNMVQCGVNVTVNEVQTILAQQIVARFAV